MLSFLQIDSFILIFHSFPKKRKAERAFQITQISSTNLRFETGGK